MLAAIARAIAAAIRTDVDAEILKVIGIFSGGGLLLSLAIVAVRTGIF